MNDGLPTIILLLQGPAGRDDSALRLALQRVAGPEAAASLEYVGQNASGMTYHRWRMGHTTCNIGQCTGRYRDVGGTLDAMTGRMIEWHDRDPGVPGQPGLRAAWEAHGAFMYADAISTSPECVPTLYRLAAALLDEDCLLVWDWRGLRPPSGLMCLPTPEVRAALACGRWPSPGHGASEVWRREGRGAADG